MANKIYVIVRGGMTKKKGLIGETLGGDTITISPSLSGDWLAKIVDAKGRLMNGKKIYAVAGPKEYHESKKNADGTVKLDKDGKPELDMSKPFTRIDAVLASENGSEIRLAFAESTQQEQLANREFNASLAKLSADVSVNDLISSSVNA